MKKRASGKSAPRRTRSAVAAGPAVQGEGDYESARRYRADVEHFVATADIERAARAAAPKNAKEAAEMAAAETAGRRRAKLPVRRSKTAARAK